MTRVTVTGERLEDPAEGAAWLKRMMGGEGADEVRVATRIVNRALDALRAAARDPLVQDIGASKALAVRLGYGTGDELADGSWTEAKELSAPGEDVWMTSIRPRAWRPCWRGATRCTPPRP